MAFETTILSCSCFVVPTEEGVRWFSQLCPLNVNEASGWFLLHFRFDDICKSDQRITDNYKLIGELTKNYLEFGSHPGHLSITQKVWRRLLAGGLCPLPLPFKKCCSGGFRVCRRYT